MTMQTPEETYSDDKPFIDIKLDYGFKWYFGQLKRKRNIIRYLNAIFKRAGRDIIVNDVSYHDKEVLPDSVAGKRIIYDIYCTSPEGHHFILEMQNAYEPYIVDRVVYYTTKVIAGQGVAGDPYEVDPVFSIIITSFNLKELPKQLFHDIVLYDKETQTVFSDKLNMFIICLPELPKEWKDCKTEFERLSYLVNRMGTLTKDSEEYQDMEYRDFINDAEKSNMSDSEYVLYSQSRLKDEEYKRSIEWASKEAEEKGKAEGIGIGRQEGIGIGRQEGIGIGKRELLNEIVKKSKAMGLPIDQMSTLLGLTSDEINAIPTA